MPFCRRDNDPAVQFLLQVIQSMLSMLTTKMTWPSPPIRNVSMHRRRSRRRRHRHHHRQETSAHINAATPVGSAHPANSLHLRSRRAHAMPITSTDTMNARHFQPDRLSRLKSWFVAASVLLLQACGSSNENEDRASLPAAPTPLPADEQIAIVRPTGTALADAQLGQPLQVEWTLPTTFSISSVRLFAFLFTSNDDAATTHECAALGSHSSTSATTGTIIIPTRCNEKRIARVQLKVVVRGMAGEQVAATHEFRRTPAEEFVPTATDLPIVRITTEGSAPIVSKAEYVSATLTIDPNGTDAAALSVPLRIRGRGNSTWAMPKKPYKLKLDEKTSLLGMPADRDWVLLANYADKSLLRNQVAFELGHRVGLAWSPRFRSVELFVNDEYLGVYQLGEGIKVAAHRVDIPELNELDTSGSALTGGYLLEVDERLDGDVYYVTRLGVPFVLDTPEEPTPEQLSYIWDYIQQTEDAILASDFADPLTGYAAYIDVDSFVNWYLVNELLKNNDAVFWSSCWMYKQREGKLFMGPLWDFDIAAGNINYNGNDDPTGWWIRNSRWISRLFEDPAFETRVKARWNELKVEHFDTILDYIDESAAALALGASNNFNRWSILDQPVGVA